MYSDILPESTVLSSTSETIKALGPRAFYLFSVAETPLKGLLNQAFTEARPKAVLVRQKERIADFVRRRLVLVVFIISLIVNIIHIAAVPGASEHWFESMLVKPAYVLLPLLAHLLPRLWWVLQASGNAYLYCLFDELQLAKKALSRDDIDEFEFDGAPAVKDVKVDPRVVARRFVQLLVGTETATLFRTANLLYAFGNSTVLCVLDKEGTVAKVRCVAFCGLVAAFFESHYSLLYLFL